MRHELDAHALIERMRKGDVTALMVLYDRHAPAALAHARRILGNPADAEDVVQETFLQAWHQAARFDSTRAGVERWLLMITRSRALDRLRRLNGRARKEEGLANLDELRAGPEWATDGALLREDDGRPVRDEVDALPATQRIALELSFYEGLTHAEIADVLCQPLGTIKTRIRLALHRMRDRLNALPTATAVSLREPSPFTVALAQYLANRPLLTATYRSLTGIRVLVVDDDAETVDLVNTVLQSAGAIVVTARTTSEGLQRLGSEWPDVILADIAMPGDDGYELIRRARTMADASGRRLLAVAFTALGNREQEKALRAASRPWSRSLCNRMRSSTSSRDSPVKPRSEPDVIGTGRTARRATLAFTEGAPLRCRLSHSLHSKRWPWALKTTPAACSRSSPCCVVQATSTC